MAFHHSHCREWPFPVERGVQRWVEDAIWKSCLEQRRHFAPYVVDTYGLLGEEAKAFNKRIASKLADKFHSPYSATIGFVIVRVSVAIVRATHLCIRGSRVPYRHVSTKRSQWEDGAGLGLLQSTP